MDESNKLILLIALALASGLFGFLIGYLIRGLREIEIRTKHILETLKPKRKDGESICPSCGRMWDFETHDACLCGAALEK